MLSGFNKEWSQEIIGYRRSGGKIDYFLRISREKEEVVHYSPNPILEKNSPLSYSHVLFNLGPQSETHDISLEKEECFFPVASHSLFRPIVWNGKERRITDREAMAFLDANKERYGDRKLSGAALEQFLERIMIPAREDSITIIDC